MTTPVRARTPSPDSFGDLVRRLSLRPSAVAPQARTLRREAYDYEALQKLAQMALQVEFATIPVYLTGMYSLTDAGSEPYQVLRSVVMEEMFHLNLAANLVVALGGLPRFTGDAAPRYPGTLPGANPATTPLVGLYPASTSVFEQVYCAIERPAPAGAPGQREHFDTIGQLYEALRQAIQEAPDDVFGHQKGVQRTDIYLGKFGGKVTEIHTKAEADAAITQIVQQGEGVVPVHGEPPRSLEPFGAYNQYGPRQDGTYGPILGTPLELSHFYKFRQVATSTAPFPSGWPITANPVEENYTNPEARELSRAFDTAYSQMLVALESTFRAATPDPFFGVVLNLMHDVLPNLALSMMQTPTHAGGDASVGPNATPSWSWLPGTALSGLRLELVRLCQEQLPDGVSAALEQAAVGLSHVPPRF